VTYRLIGYALALAPVALVVGLIFNRITGWASQRGAYRSWLLIPAIAGAGLLVGVCSHWWPELPGNGRSILNVILGDGMTLKTAAAVLVLKVLLTAMFLRAGARGGLFTPALATGAAAGTLLVLAINAIAGTHFHVPAIALAGSAGVLAITQRAPLWAAIFVWELARPPLWLLLVFLVAALSTYGLRLLVERFRKLVRP
jgi:H+/Cl- antiporter ClcA